jgi:hypothetical protein
MKTRIALIMMLLLCMTSAAVAEEDTQESPAAAEEGAQESAEDSAAGEEEGPTFTLYGSISLGVWSVDDGDADDAAKLNEYRHLESGAFGGIDIQGHGPDYYVGVFGENLGRDDRYVGAEGGL